jgi:putative ABC transport system permease protein
VTAWRVLVARLCGALGRGPRDEDLEQELEFHRQQLEDRYRAGGLGPAEARRAARLDLGGSAQIAEAFRDQRSVPAIETLRQDVRYGFRILRRTRGFTVTALLTLALGIGATTAIFSIVDAVLLQPLPYAQADRLAVVGETGSEGDAGNVGYATLLDWRARSQSFEAFALFRSWNPTLVVNGEAERLDAMRVSANFFALLGVRPALGRDFSANEDRPDQWRVLLLSDSLWRRRFGADPQIVGRLITMNDRDYRIVGVMPREFEPLISQRYYQAAQLWAPLGYALSGDSSCRSCQHLKAIGRLRPGVRSSQASAEMTAIHRQLVTEYPNDYAPGSIAVQPLRDALAGRLKPALLVLAAAVAFVLVIACANVANLLLSRALQRQREMALRAALGAGRRRLVRQLLTESVMLSLGGAVLGVFVGMAGVAVLARLAPLSIPRLDRTGLDGRMLAFTLGVALITGVLFGLVPALRGSALDLQHTLASDSRSTVGGSARARAILVVVDLVLALVLLAGAGLMLRTVGSILRVDPGFTYDRLLTVQFSLVGKAYAEDKAVVAFQDRLLTRVRALPGVQSAALAGQIPLGGNGDCWGFHVRGLMKPNTAEDPCIERYAVTADYFRALNVPIVAGRGFSEQDQSSSQPVMIVARATAQTLWPGRSPLGQQVRIGSATEGPWRTVIGIAGDVRHTDLTSASRPQMYMPQAQNTDSFLVLVARTGAADASALIGPIREAIRQMDPAVPVYQVATMEDLVAKTVAQRRFVMQLLGGFSILAVLLAALGLYGVVSYGVAQRTREMGVRLALGAAPHQIGALVLWRGAALVASGLGIGFLAALVSSRFLGTLVFGVTTTDPATFFGSVGLLASVALLAHWLPVRRAMRIDPAVALRHE